MLTEKQKKYLNDRDFLLNKHSISEFLVSELSVLEEALKQEIQSADFQFPRGTFTKSGKISKGENYKGLPFFILDYPRLFTHSDMFAYRNMIWWGHEISFSLLLQGRSLEQFRKQLISSFNLVENFYFCIHDDPWEYHFEADNYRLVKSIGSNDYENQVQKRDFIKLAKKIPLSELDNMTEHSIAFFKELLMIMHRDSIQKDH